MTQRVPVTYLGDDVVVLSAAWVAAQPARLAPGAVCVVDADAVPALLAREDFTAGGEPPQRVSIPEPVPHAAARAAADPAPVPARAAAAAPAPAGQVTRRALRATETPTTAPTTTPEPDPDTAPEPSGLISRSQLSPEPPSVTAREAAQLEDDLADAGLSRAGTHAEKTARLAEWRRRYTMTDTGTITAITPDMIAQNTTTPDTTNGA